MLSSPSTARGEHVGALGMVLAVGVDAASSCAASAPRVDPRARSPSGAVVGWVIARRVQMTAMPQMVALLNGLGGLASALVSIGEILRRAATPDAMTAVVALRRRRSSAASRSPAA